MSRRRELSLGAWLALGFGAAIALLGTLAVTSLGALGAIAAQTDRQAGSIVPRQESAVELRVAISGVGIAVRAYVLAPGAPRRAEAQLAVARMEEAAERLRALPREPDGQALFQPIPGLVHAFGARALALLDARDVVEAEARLAEARAALVPAVEGYLDLQREKLARSRAEIAAAQRRSRDMLVWTSLVLTFVLAAIAYLVARAVRGPALALADAARRVSGGDWTAGTALAPPGDDGARSRNELKDLARSFGRMAEALREREARLAHQNERLQSQNEKLHAQQEELRAQQEELQAQNEEIQAQSEELQAQNEELRAQEDELRRSEEELRQADRRKDEFLAVLSHELRNPLAPIVNALSVLQGAEPSGQQATRAREIIARQVRQLTRLIDDLLDVTRVSRGKIELQRTHVSLGRIVVQAAEDCRSILEQAGIRLQVDVPDAQLWIHADPARVAQVVSNLLQNAAKFTPHGGTVSVRVERHGGRAEIRVRDDGIGIAPEVLSRLFVPFVQADTSLARTRGGLGLGLALVRSLVELHGGSVTATSGGLGTGSEFKIELPLDGEPVGPAAPAPASGNARRILVVEDDPDGAETLRDLLALDGHEVEIAADGEEGLLKARAFRPDLVLCDVGLPTMDGYALARRIREDPALRGTLVVALTGHARLDDHDRAAEAGFHAHLAKPATPEGLHALIARTARTPSDGA